MKLKYVFKLTMQYIYSLVFVLITAFLTGFIMQKKANVLEWPQKIQILLGVITLIGMSIFTYYYIKLLLKKD